MELAQNYLVGKRVLEFVHQSNRMQTDWKNVGGKKRSQK